MKYCWREMTGKFKKQGDKAGKPDASEIGFEQQRQQQRQYQLTYENNNKQRG